MHVLMTTFCEQAQLRPDGKLDVHGAFHDLMAPGFPAKQDEMVLVVAVEWSPEDAGRFQFKIDLVGDAPHPSLTINGETEVKPYVEGDRPARTFLIMPVHDVVFPTAGAYRLEVKIKGETVPGPTLHLWEIEEEASRASPN